MWRARGGGAFGQRPQPQGDIASMSRRRLRRGAARRSMASDLRSCLESWCAIYLELAPTCWDDVCDSKLRRFMWYVCSSLDHFRVGWVGDEVADTPHLYSDAASFYELSLYHAQHDMRSVFSRGSSQSLPVAVHFATTRGSDA